MCTEGTYFNTVKIVYNKHTASIILNGEKSKAFPLRLEAILIWGCPLPPLLLNIVLEVLQEQARKKIEGMQIRQEDAKLSYFGDDVIFYRKHFKESTENC